MKKMSSRDRMVNTIDGMETDYIPCSFMSFTALRNKFSEDVFALCEKELAMGLDPLFFLRTPRRKRKEHPDLRGMPIRFHPEVTTKERREEVKGDFDILHKEYITPAGILTTSVRLSDDWPHGEHIPFIDDYQVPRGIKPLVTGPEDLEPLQFLLAEPGEEETAEYFQSAKKAQAFARNKEVLFAVGWGVGFDMVEWLCGMENAMLLMTDQPDFIGKLLEMIHEWNLARMKIYLKTGADLFVRRAWYEGVDFLVPDFYRSYVLPFLKKEVELAHEHNTRFGYNCSSGTLPMLDNFLASGMDVLIGIDPIQGTHTDLPLIKKKADDRLSLWGGVSGAVTVETGTEEEVREAVQTAITRLGPERFILSPVDNITVDAPKTWANIEVFIDEWQKQRA